MNLEKIKKILTVIFVVSVLTSVYLIYDYLKDLDTVKKQNNELQQMINGNEQLSDTIDQPNVFDIKILEKYKSVYDKNNDFIGWLKIEGTTVDYPVMQTKNDEGYYLRKDFEKNQNLNGSLFVSALSEVGVGKTGNNYENGIKPSTNIMIYGHSMKSGEMFGNLEHFNNKVYASQHPIIKFDTLYEEREYEIISVFYSQIYYEHDQVFKFYQFYDAETEDKFDYWYQNIKNLSIYDTNVEATYGDEFITLVTCAYHTENGRFVVVGKRLMN